MVGFIQGEVSAECNETPNCSGSHKAGKDWDLLSFLAVFKICLGSETPECNGEVGLLLVPTPLEATVTTLVKNSLKSAGSSPPLKPGKLISIPRKICFSFVPGNGTKDVCARNCF